MKYEINDALIIFMAEINVESKVRLRLDAGPFLVRQSACRSGVEVELWHQKNSCRTHLHMHLIENIYMADTSHSSFMIHAFIPSFLPSFLHSFIQSFIQGFLVIFSCLTLSLYSLLLAFRATLPFSF